MVYPLINKKITLKSIICTKFTKMQPISFLVKEKKINYFEFMHTHTHIHNHKLLYDSRDELEVLQLICGASYSNSE